MNYSNEHVSFANSRVFITLFLHLIFGFIFSFMPEENEWFWLKLNFCLAILLAVTNFIIWIYHKGNSKRYFSLHSFVMFIGMIIFSMSPIFRVLYSTVYFWLLLLLTVGLAAFLLIKYKAVTKVIVTPEHPLFGRLLILYVGVLLLVGSVVWMYMLTVETSSWFPIGILLYIIALFFVLIAPAMLATPELVEELEEAGDDDC